MAYEDSDYTFMIAIMHCPNRTILVLKLTLVVEIQALLLCRRPPLLSSTLVASTVLRSPHKDSDHTAVIADTFMPKLTELAKL